ncbi:hypothetical protein [Ornithinimicrobium kibberense]|uniref:hypothetical protein n=1 Tax=Ornithinimicrobium kibberense TaxID=282060 RepID=UPI00361B444A
MHRADDRLLPARRGHAPPDRGGGCVRAWPGGADPAATVADRSRARASGRRADGRDQPQRQGCLLPRGQDGPAVVLGDEPAPRPDLDHPAEAGRDDPGARLPPVPGPPRHPCPRSPRERPGRG